MSPSWFLFVFFLTVRHCTWYPTYMPAFTLIFVVQFCTAASLLPLPLHGPVSTWGPLVIRFFWPDAAAIRHRLDATCIVLQKVCREIQKWAVWRRTVLWHILRILPLCNLVIKCLSWTLTASQIRNIAAGSIRPLYTMLSLRDETGVIVWILDVDELCVLLEIVVFWSHLVDSKTKPSVGAAVLKRQIHFFVICWRRCSEPSNMCSELVIHRVWLRDVDVVIAL